jgi:hypothetical protein
MDEQMTVQAYETPRVVDYGDLQELTAACLGGSGGDAFDPSGQAGNYGVGPSNPAAGCTSRGTSP